MEELKKRIAEELGKLEKLNSAFGVCDIDLDEEWEMNLEEEDWTGRVNYGSLSNYLLFIDKREDGPYLVIVCEVEPEMVTRDWLFQKGMEISSCDYDFSGSAYDVAADYSYDNAEPVFEAKL